jgi:hypothetical protein
LDLEKSRVKIYTEENASRMQAPHFIAVISCREPVGEGQRNDLPSSLRFFWLLFF